jgi:hypothetical protein
VSLPGKGPDVPSDGSGSAGPLGEAWDDLAAGDEAQLIVRYLRAIAEAQGALSGPLPESTAGEESQEEPKYAYFSDLTATSTPRKLADWGTPADTVAVRAVSGPARVAFADPDTNDRVWIPVDVDTSPLILSGVYGIDASAIWAEETGGADVTMDVLAVETEG